MKLTMIKVADRPVPAALLTSETLVDLSAASKAGLLGEAPVNELADILDLDGPLFDLTRSLVDRLESGETALLDQLVTLGAIHEEDTAVYSKILRPGLLLSCGMAYNDHLEEMNTPPPPNPTAFMKLPNAMIAHKEAIVLPSDEPDQVDFECEMALVIGRPLYRASPEEALSCIAGFTMINDVGVRKYAGEFIKAMTGDDPRKLVYFNTLNIAEKQRPTFCPMGPVIETVDTFGDVNDFLVETRLNGEVMQSAHSSDLIFPIATSLSYFAQWYKFLPGDVMTTGSPAGVGFARNPPRLLREGDVIEVSCPKIGACSNPVVAEK